jgi:uncharacterized membrane protein
MSDRVTHALLAVYPNRGYADAAVTYLQGLERSDLIEVDGVAVIARDLDGKVTAEEVGASTGKRGAGRGAMAGAVVGLIFPPSIIGAAVVGAGIGGLAGRLAGRTGHQPALQEMGEQLERGHTGVVVIVGDAAVDRVIERLTGYEALHRRRVDPKTLAAIGDEETDPEAT